MLAMALTLFVAWMRSYGIIEELVIRNEPSIYHVVSVCGVLSLSHETPYPYPVLIKWVSLNPLMRDDFRNVPEYLLQWKLAGFEFGKGKWPGYPELFICTLIIPYWPLVLLLTLISGWMLLSKSRKTKPAP